jgi:hypothetical protein
MPRRGATITQADIARVIRAYRNEGVSVRTRLLPDGSTSFEPIVRDESESAEVNAGRREIVL